MLRIPVRISLTAALSLSTIGAHADAVDDYIREQMARHHIPGVALAVVQNGKTVKQTGYGYANLELNTPVGPDTAFLLASVSKQFTSAAVMLLVQDGKLTVDTTLGAIFKDTPEPLRGITLHQLMTHTSGLQREGPLKPGSSYRDDVPEEEMWRSLRHIELQSEPGTRFSYSNLGYNILSLVIEKKSGVKYAEFMKKRVFEPLGMTGTRINDLSAVVPHRATGYTWANGKYANAEHVSPTTYIGAGEVLSTVIDLQKWDAAFRSGKVLTDRSRSVLLSGTPMPNGVELHYGGGWVVGQVRAHHFVGHDGLLAGFRSYIVRYTDDGLTVILLANNSNLDDPGRISQRVADLYIDGLREELPAAVKGRPEQFTSYTGRYESSNNSMLTVAVKDGKLTARFPSDAADDLTPIAGDNAFFSFGEDTRFTFVKDKSGKVTAVKIKVGEGEHEAPRIGPLSSGLPRDGESASKAVALKVKTALHAIVAGGSELRRCRWVTPGARTDFATGEPLSGLDTMQYIGSSDAPKDKLERHGGKVERILYYRISTTDGPRILLVHLAHGDVVTDEDLVEE